MSLSIDEIDVQDGNGNLVVTIRRAVGFMETGREVGGTWVPAGGPEQVFVPGFAINSAGVAYFDSIKVDSGDEAELFIDAQTSEIWVYN